MVLDLNKRQEAKTPIAVLRTLIGNCYTFGKGADAVQSMLDGVKQRDWDILNLIRLELGQVDDSTIEFFDSGIERFLSLPESEKKMFIETRQESEVQKPGSPERR